jgi:LacI family transcriptional regulator, repressor for deo operon, udp, cdd, tsx, nupC, and nupG
MSGRSDLAANRASIFDVATRARVSPATVSRALRGAPNVSAATRERVAAAARELAYVASPAASRLASGRTSTIGIVVPFIDRWFFTRVVQGAEAVVRAAGYDLLLYNLADRSGRERFFDRIPLRRKVDGVIMVDVATDPREEAQLTELGVPVTVVGGTARGVGTVGIDDAEGVRMAVRHLAHLGHQQIGMLCGELADGLARDVPGRRRDSFQRAVAEAGLETSPEWVVIEPWGLEGGATATARLLCAPGLPTALLAESDEIAFGVLRTLHLAGLDVPGRMSVIGFDDHEMASIVNLTTIAQPVLEQGEIAATLLLEALQGHPGPSAPVTLPTRLVVRGSTAPPGVGNRRGGAAASAAGRATG